MALNPLDDALEQLPPGITAPPAAAEAPASAAATPGDSLFDRAQAVLAARRAAEETELRRAALRNKQNPDQAIEARRLGRRYHTPTPVVEHALDEYRQRAAADDLVKAGTDNPRLGAWVAQDPAHAALAAPDLVPLSALDRTLGVGRNIAGAAAAGLMDFVQGTWGAVEAAMEAGGPGSSLVERGAAVAAPEVTRLQPGEEQAFQAWVRSNAIADVDDPRSFYDYRGYWQQIAASGEDPARLAPGPRQLPDTFKQHGHPTFSVASQYSTGALDGGTWGGPDGRTFQPGPPGAPHPVAEFAHLTALVAKHLADKARGEQPGAGFLEKAAYSGVESLGQMVPGLIGSAITGGTGLMLTAAGATTGGQSYNDAREQGVRPARALGFAAIQGAIEVATEFLPAERLFKDLAEKATLRQLFAHQIKTELVGEEVATALQDLNEWAFLPANKDRTLMDYWRERPSAIVATAISVVTSTGLTSVLTHGTQRMLDQLKTAADASETVKKDPAAVADFLEQAGGDTTLYAPVDTFTTYWQSKGEDPAVVAARLTGDPKAYAQAGEAGLLEIPASRYTALLAGTEHHAFFRDELTLHPDVPNAREEAEFAAREAAEPTEAGEEAPSRRTQIRQALTDQLIAGGRYRPTDADTNARLVESALGTMAEAAGEDPLAVYRSYGVEVARPDVGPAARVSTPATPTPDVSTIAPPVSEAPADEAIEAEATGEATPTIEAPAADAAAEVVTDQVTPAQTSAQLPHNSTIDTAAVTEVGPAAEPLPPIAAEILDTTDPVVVQEPAPPPVKKTPHEDALDRLSQGGIYYGPRGLKVRIVPKATPGHFELEVTEKGKRRFEGDFTAEQGPLIGADRVAELVASPTKAPVTPQILGSESGTTYILAPFVAPAAPKTPPTPTGTAQEVYRAFKARLTKLVNQKDHAGIIAEADRFEAYYDDHGPFPDDHNRWVRAKEDAQYALQRAEPTVIGTPLAPAADDGPIVYPADSTVGVATAKGKGAAAFAAGKTRIVERDVPMRLADAWYAGWDQANLAAAVPDTTEQNRTEPDGTEQRHTTDTPTPVEGAIEEGPSFPAWFVPAIAAEARKAREARTAAEAAPEAVAPEAAPERTYTSITVNPREIQVGDRIQTLDYGLLTVEKVHPYDPKYPRSQIVETERGRRDFDPTGQPIRVDRPDPDSPLASTPQPEDTRGHGRIPEGPGTSAAPADSDGGRPDPAGDDGGPAVRPGDDRAARVAGVEPEAGTAVAPEPGAPKRPRKRSPRGGVSGVRAGNVPAGAGADPRAGAGVHAASHVDTADLADDPAVAAAESRGAAPRHFVIDGQAQLTEGNWQAKLADNLAALRLLKALEKEGRLATDAEQQILTRYIGWGHTELKDVVEFEGGHSTLARRDPRKQEARDELEQLLTAEELKIMGLSTANAHYSFSDLPRAMWAAVERLGFKSGSILEPAMGTGHFYGTMPGKIVASPKTTLWAVEMEPIAAAIAKHLYQDTHVQNSPLQEANLPNDYFDLQISNVPFGQIRVFDPEFNSPKRRPLAESVHNYYFGKALDLARPGGLIAFVTSRFTMDARSDTVRRFLADRADLLGAVRLPDKAFKATAGTDVVTDILFFRKREVGEAPKRGSDAWVESILNEKVSPKNWNGKIEQEVYTNSYFQKHPDLVLGIEDMSGKMARTREPQYNVPGTLTPEALQAALERALPKHVYKPSTLAPRAVAKVISKDIKQGSYQLDANGDLVVYDKGTLAPHGLKEKDIARVKRFVPLRDAYQVVLDHMIAGADKATLEAAQATLRASYAAFVAAHGLVNKAENRMAIENDPNAGRILGLEEIDLVKKKKGARAVERLKRLADIFDKRTYTPVVEATTAGTPTAALMQSLAWKGGVDLAYMQGLTGQTEAELVTALGTEIFRDPVTLAYTPRAEYLSGDVTTKLAQAQAAASTDTAYGANVAALINVLPVQFTPEDFPTPFGATWVPVDVYRRFIEAETGATITVSLMNAESRVQFYVNGFGAHEFLPAGADLAKWVEHGLNGAVPSISTKDSDGTVRVDTEATEAYRESLKQLRERWAEWWPADHEASEQLTKIYNGMFNREAPYVADGAHLHLAGSNPAITLHPWQKNVIWRALQTGNTLMAHAVGAGKTFAMIGVAGEWKRLGLAHKPLIVVPNHLTVDTMKQFRALYPAARVLVPTKADFEAGNRARLMARIANNDWDAVIMAQSHFLRVGVKLETLKTFFKEQEDQLLADGAEQMNLSAQDFQELVTGYGAKDKEATRALSGRTTPRSVKDIARAILSLRARFQRRLDQSKKDSPVTFEELGTDGLLVDEAHLYKNLFFSTAKNNIAGLKGSDADRAIDMFLKVRHINEASKGRNVIFATGTPVSNTMSELYTMFRYLAQPTLAKMGMAGFDSWANGNAEATAEMEKSPAGGYKERTRLRKWTNLRELSAQFRKFSDVVTTQDLIDSKVLVLPKPLNGHPTVVALEPHPDMADFMGELVDRLEQLKTGKVDPKDDNNLKISSDASMAAIDMRLVRPGAAVQEDGRIPTAAKLIAERYRQTAAAKSTQLVFLDIGVPDKKHMPPLPLTVTSSEGTLGEVDAEDLDPDQDGIVDLEAEGEAERLALAALGHDVDLYTDLRARLVAQGVRDDEIAYLHQAQTPFEQGQLYEAMNAGRIRVLFATTAKGGVGMNVQKKLKFIHHLDVPWKPADVEQRNGRIYRQGNEHAEIEELRYVTKNSYDEYRWGLLASKQASIVALMKGQLTSLDDVDPAQLDMQVAQALASGNPKTLTMLNLQREVQALQVRFKAYTARINAAKRNLQAGTEAIARLTAERTALEPLRTSAAAWQEAPILSVVARPSSYRETEDGDPFDLKDPDARKVLQARLETMLQAHPYQEEVPIGTGGPYTLRLHRTDAERLVSEKQPNGSFLITTRANTAYYLSVAVALPGGQRQTLGATPQWSEGDEKFPAFVRSLDSLLAPERLEKLDADKAKTIQQWENGQKSDRSIAAKPFGNLDQLREKEQALADVQAELGIERGVPKANAEGKAFGQPDIPDEPPAPEPPPKRRGSIEFGTDPVTGLPRTLITLMARADLSTFLHESGHFFLEVFGDLADRVRAKDPATHTPEQARLLADYDATLQELGVTTRDEIGTAQHEQWAEAFETYLREGHAPALELVEPFARFRAWLLDIYRSVRGRTPVSPALRGVFDRMLAGEDAIAAAERQMPPLFKNAAEAGMSERRYQLYRERVEEVHRQARETLDRLLMAEVHREQTAQWQAQRADIEADVTAEVQQQPVYRALGLLREGLPSTGPDDVPVPMPFDHAALVEAVGAARVNALPDGLTVPTDGTDPALIAEIAGFDSADALVQAILDAPPMADVVKTETDRRMNATHGALLLDGTLPEQARAATGSDDHDALIREEIKALWVSYEESQKKLARKTAEGNELRATARGGAAFIQRATPRADTIARLARERIAATPIRKLRPETYWSEARRAAKDAIAKAARQDLPGAVVAKTKQLTNLAYYREAVRVRALVEASRRWVDEHDRPKARARLGKAGEDYLDQWDGILDRFDFKRITQKVLDRRDSLAKFIADQEEKGLQILLPEIVLNEARRKNYSLLTTEEFLGVTDGLRALEHVARLKNRLLKAEAGVVFDDITATIGDSIREHNVEHDLPLEFMPKDERVRRVGDWFANHAKIARLARGLDGHRDAGPMWEHIIRPINAAADAQVEQKRAAAVAYHAILQRFYPGRALATLRTKQFIPKLGASLSKEARLAVALNWGNQTSRDRLVSDPQRRWNQDQVEAILDTLDQRDWDFVQATWDYINRFWPAIAAKQERVVGLAPEKVEALPVSTKFGEYRGGYYPLMYDGRLNLRAGQHEIAGNLKLAALGNYVAATTKRGHVETRLQNVHMSVKLDLSVVYSHLEQVIHDLTHHEMLIDTSRLLRDPRVQQAIFETQGDIVYKQFTTALLDIATDSQPANNILDKAANWARAGTQIASLGLNFWTAVQQPLGVFNGMSRVGVSWVARGMKRWLRDAASLQNTMTWITSVSPMMKHRSDTATPELHDLHRALRQPGNWFDTLVKTVSHDHLTQQTITDGFLWHIGLMQRVADIPTWLGQYEKSMAAGHPEDRAIALADQAVLDSQGGGQMKDLAQVQRGSAVAKLYMTFYSYGSTVLNETADRYGAMKVRSPASVVTFLGHLGLLYAMPALATMALSRAFGKSGDDDDDAQAFLTDVGQEMLSTALNGWVLAREFTQLLGEGTRGYAGPAGGRIIQLFYDLGQQVKQGEADEALAKAANAAAGVVFRYPAAQVQRTIDGFVALEEGRTSNPFALVVGAPKKEAR